MNEVISIRQPVANAAVKSIQPQILECFYIDSGLNTQQKQISESLAIERVWLFMLSHEHQIFGEIAPTAPDFIIKYKDASGKDRQMFYFIGREEFVNDNGKQGFLTTDQSLFVTRLVKELFKELR